MAITETLGNIFTAAKALYDLVELVKANQEQCKTLATRVRTAVNAIENLDVQKNPKQYEEGLIAIKDCLDDCTTFIKQFSEDQKKWYKKLLRAGAAKEKFEELNDQLQKAVSLLNLGMVAKQIVDREQDRKDHEKDLVNLGKQQKFLIELTEKNNIGVNQLLMCQDEQQLKQEERQAILLAQLASLRAHVEQLKKPNEKPKIDPKITCKFFELEIGGLISQGSFGTVHIGEWADQQVAIKMPGELGASSMDQFIREVQIMSRLRSPNVVQLYAACIEPENPCLVMEYMEHGSLYHYLKKNKLNTLQKKQIALDIAKGMLYLHKNEIFHRDLKSANVLLTNGKSGLQAKITDFGLSRANTQSIQSVHENSLDLAWQAPECLTSDNFSAAADVYSFGVILWEIISNKQPFEDCEGLGVKKNTEIYRRVSQGKRDVIPKDAPLVYTKLIQDCWNTDPTKRPSMQEIVKILQSDTLKNEKVISFEINMSPANKNPKMIQFSKDTSNSGIKKENNEDSEGYYKLGLKLEEQKKTTEALVQYKKAVELGSIKAHTNIGMFYLQGLGGLNKDKKAAFNEFNIAAAGGHPRAMLNLANMLERGDGVIKDEDKAIYWYNEASNKGDGNIKSIAQQKSVKLNKGKNV